MAAFLNWRYNMFFKSPLGSGLLMWIIVGLVGGNSFSMVHRFRPLRIRVGLDRTSKWPNWDDPPSTLLVSRNAWGSMNFLGVFQCLLFRGVFFGVVSFREGNMDAPQLLLGHWESKVTMFVFSICSFLGENVILSFLYQKASTWIATSLFVCFFRSQSQCLGGSGWRMKHYKYQQRIYCLGKFVHISEILLTQETKTTKNPSLWNRIQTHRENVQKPGW